MALSARLLRAVIEEVAPAITGGWIQKIYQPTDRSIILDIRTPGRSHRLFLSADPETARLHLLRHCPPNPPRPPAFCQYLRAHIHGARVERLEQVDDDRIVRLVLTARHGPCALMAELTGRTANLLLIGGDDTILSSLDPERARPGQPYRLPPTRLHLDDTADDAERGIEATEAFPLSARLERTFRQCEETAARERLVQQRRAEIAKRIKKTSRRLEALRADWEKANRYKEYARYGELLKSRLHAIAKGQDQIVVVDYFDPRLPELVLPLDPAKSAQGNLDDYFKKHRKYVTAEHELRPRIAQAEAELAALKDEQARLTRGEWISQAATRAVPVMIKTGRPPAGKTAGPAHGPFRRFVSSDGCPIYVGRNATENERLTFGEARPDDLWLHARGVPGSHVVVRLEKGSDPLPDTLHEAAILAVLYSDLKKAGKGEVLYTRRKYVRKVKGKPPGTVTVTQEKSLFVTLDRRRLDALNARRAAP